MSRRIDREVTLFPQPDSPTIPTVPPAGISKDTSSTARSTPESVANSVTRFSTRNKG